MLTAVGPKQCDRNITSIPQHAGCCFYSLFALRPRKYFHCELTYFFDRGNRYARVESRDDVVGIGHPHPQREGCHRSCARVTVRTSRGECFSGSVCGVAISLFLNASLQLSTCACSSISRGNVYYVTRYRRGDTLIELRRCARHGVQSKGTSRGCTPRVADIK